MPFSTLGLGPPILRAIRDAGYAEPTPIQTRAVPAIMKGGDVIGIAQTGTGKTAAYVWPIIQRLVTVPPTAGRGAKPHPRVLVLAPTRELAAQIEENLRAYARYLPLRCAAIYGGVSDFPQIQALRAGVDIIVATPGRLLDLMSTLQAPVRDVEVLVLDEADRMLDMGFIPDIRRIVRALPQDRQTLLFSATFAGEIEKISREFLREAQMVEVGRRATPAEQVSQFIYEVSRARKTDLLLHLLEDEGLDSVLVFTRTKHGADKLAKQLTAAGVSTGSLHSNRSQNQRMAALKGFKSGHYRVLVATDIAARGIDVDGISHVINYDFPPQPEDYVHRIGRTGRVHAIGDALSFVTSEDQAALRALERFIGRGVPRRQVAEFEPTTGVHGERERPERETRRPRSGGAGRPGSGGGRGAGPRRGESGGRPSGRSGGGEGRSERPRAGDGGGRRAERGPGEGGGRGGAPPRGDGGGRRSGPGDAGGAKRGRPGEAEPLKIPEPGDITTWGRKGKPGRRRR
jgi:ATP-dependent RNA helicase RhlE